MSIAALCFGCYMTLFADGEYLDLGTVIYTGPLEIAATYWTVEDQVTLSFSFYW